MDPTEKAMNQVFVDYYLLGCNAMYFNTGPLSFQRIIPPQSSGPKTKPNKIPAINR
jgi:hypothetical protein